jgi:hypothetical protein
MNRGWDFLLLMKVAVHIHELRDNRGIFSLSRRISTQANFGQLHPDDHEAENIPARNSWVESWQ